MSRRSASPVGRVRPVPGPPPCRHSPALGNGQFAAAGRGKRWENEPDRRNPPGGRPQRVHLAGNGDNHSADQRNRQLSDEFIPPPAINHAAI